MKKKNPEIPRDWFVNWFDEWYLTVYRRRDKNEAKKLVSRLPIWDYLREIKKPDNWDCWCLDVGCGSGRYAREIAAKGFEVLGVDLSKTLLKKADSEISHTSPYYVQADMRKLPVLNKFVLAASLFTSFGYFKSISEHKTVLRQIYNCLLDKGVFILDIPNKKTLERFVEGNPNSERRIDNVRVIENRWIDKMHQRVNKEIQIIGNKIQRTYYESVRLFERAEIEGLLLESGFNLDEFSPWGDYTGKTLTENSPRMIHFGVRNA